MFILGCNMVYKLGSDSKETLISIPDGMETEPWSFRFLSCQV